MIVDKFYLVKTHQRGSTFTSTRLIRSGAHLTLLQLPVYHTTVHKLRLHDLDTLGPGQEPGLDLPLASLLVRVHAPGSNEAFVLMVGELTFTHGKTDGVDVRLGINTISVSGKSLRDPSDTF